MTLFPKEEDKAKLLSCIETTNNFVLLTTGRAGTDFLQSCYDSHPQVASTCEKSLSFAEFISKNYSLIPHSVELFSALALEQLKFSFAPYLNEIEDWRIAYNDNYRKANIHKFIDTLCYLLICKGKEPNYLHICRSIIIAFAYSSNQNIEQIKTILIHLHHIPQLKFYSNYLGPKDLILICSRSIYSLVSSGVFHRRKYWFNRKEYHLSLDLGHYRRVYNRVVFDYIDVNDSNSSDSAKLFLVMLENLGKIENLNSINRVLNIDEFKNYPGSTVLGINRRGDQLSSDSREKALGKFDSNLVFRGSPFELIGIIDSLLITTISSLRINKYNVIPKNKYIRYILSRKKSFRYIIFLFLLPFPTRIELIYLYSAIPSICKLIKDQNINISNKIKRLFISFIYIFLYPYEYIAMRISRMRAIKKDSDINIMLKNICSD